MMDSTAIAKFFRCSFAVTTVLLSAIGGKLPSPVRACPAPVLDRLQRYESQAGETLASVAAKFDLVPGTLIGFNPVLKKFTAASRLPMGTEILVPPVNGVRAEIPAGVTWQDLEAAYGVRADTLFEINGCQREPREIFVPGLRWSPPTAGVSNYTGFPVQPLPAASEALLPYGVDAATGTFHSGLDLAAAPGTPVRAVDAGNVVFAGEDETYGNLVVVNHTGQRQTRYAHLDRFEVAVGETVTAGQNLGVTGLTGRPDIPQPHLHFEVRLQTPQGWLAQDPALHLMP